MKSSPTMNTYLIEFFKNIIKNDPAYMIDANEKQMLNQVAQNLGLKKEMLQAA